jgi:VWFA-related protein
MHVIRLFAVLMLVPSLTFSGMQQSPDNELPGAPLKIQVESNLVLRSVTVKDKDGRPIEGLTEKDFIVTENGIRQTVSVCEFQQLDDTPLPPMRPRSILSGDVNPLSLIGQKQVSSGSRDSGRRDGIQYQDRRLLVLYFDLMTMPKPDKYRAFDAGRRYIQSQMAEPDLMAIMIFHRNVVRVFLDFTGDREMLDLAIQTLMKETEEEGDLTLPDTAAAFGQNSAEFNLFNTDRQLAALQNAVKMLGMLNERKSLIYFASGLRLNGMDNQAQLRATINAAVRANVMFYPVDARGLVAQAPLGDATRPSSGGVGMLSGMTAMDGMSFFQQSQDSLFALASNTGGKAMLDYNDLSLGIVNAQKALCSYYIIGYYTTNPEKDGKFRRIKISLADERSASLDYRKGYYADKEFSEFAEADKERQLEEALMLGDPITDLTIMMEVNYFRLNSAEYYVPVAVKIPGRELILAKETGSTRTVIDFIGEIRDDYGTVYTNLRDKVSFKLKGETAEALLSSPIEYDCGFTLLPGKYIIKILARNAETGRIGTYQTTFRIPNLMKPGMLLPISSVVLSSQKIDLSQALYTAGKDRDRNASPLVAGGEKLIPSITRVFRKKRDMMVYLQAYENDAVTTEPLVAFVTFFRGPVKSFETPSLAVKKGLHPKSKAVPMSFSIALDKLPPGEYNCQVTVLNPTRKTAAFWQAPVMLVE